jgi:Tfp pilus assembly pilus retraction ATPase PilT
MRPFSLTYKFLHSFMSLTGAEHGAREPNGDHLVDAHLAARLLGVIVTDFYRDYVDQGRVQQADTLVYTSDVRETVSEVPLFRVREVLAQRGDTS